MKKSDKLVGEKTQANEERLQTSGKKTQISEKRSQTSEKNYQSDKLV